MGNEAAKFGVTLHCQARVFLHEEAKTCLGNYAAETSSNFREIMLAKFEVILHCQARVFLHEEAKI